MANKRMISLDIVGTDAFLSMPTTARLLYYDLLIRADDDGFIANARSITILSDCKPEDLETLIQNKFVLSLSRGVVCIKHWLIHNNIRPDRKSNTKWIEEKERLLVDENRSYSLNNGVPLVERKKERLPLTIAQRKRLDAKKESDLPFSFETTMRNKFVGEKCPICGTIMSFTIKSNSPSVNHNTPISMGGKHEIENISVICHRCNTSIGNKVVGKLNNDIVIDKWRECGGNVAGIVEEHKGNDRIGLGLDLGLDKFSKDISIKNIEQNDFARGVVNGEQNEKIDPFSKNIDTNDRVNDTSEHLTKNDLFEMFWNDYPRKVGKDKCLSWFKAHKVDDDLLADMLNAIAIQKTSEQWNKEDKKFIPHPYTWLNRGGWKDEVDMVVDYNESKPTEIKMSKKAEQEEVDEVKMREMLENITKGLK